MVALVGLAVFNERGTPIGIAGRHADSSSETHRVEAIHFRVMREEHERFGGLSP